MDRDFTYQSSGHQPRYDFSSLLRPIGQISVWIACVISIVSGIDYFMDSKDMLTESM